MHHLLSPEARLDVSVRDTLSGDIFMRAPACLLLAAAAWRSGGASPALPQKGSSSGLLYRPTETCNR
jgi:hypothetical protein